VVAARELATTESWWKRKRSRRPVCGLHERALNLATTHDGHCFGVGTLPQFPSTSPALPPRSRKNPSKSPIKILPVYSTRLPLTLHQSRRFFGCGLEGGVYQICLRRHRPKGVSAGAAGTQLLQKPALEAQGNPNLSFLVLPANKRPYPPRPIPFLKLLSLPSYHPKITRLHAPRIGPYESQKQNHFLESRFPVGRWRAIAGTYSSPSARLGYLS